MTDHYELLGVEPDATKDEIKAAYRAEVENADSARRAQLNRAWNTLSDPVQRQRYDEQLNTGGSEDDDDGGQEVAPTRRATGARRGADTTIVATNGSGSNGSSGNGSGGRGGGKDSGDNGKERPRPEPTIVLPEGLEMAPPRPRNLALLFDFSVLVVMFLIVQYVGVALIKDQYPTQVHKVDSLTKQLDKANKAKSSADDAKSKADDALAAAKKKGDSADISDAQDKADAAKEKATAADNKAKSVDSALTKAQDDIRPMYLLIQGVALLLALLYTVPMSARTGQTFGKRLRHIKLVRIDGSPAGWSASLIHYGVPIVLTLALSGFLGPLTLILGLGSVVWNLRDKNRQGINDKLAKTLVVEA